MSQHAVVMERDDEVRELIESVLRRSGIETVAAATGEEGLRLVRELQPDLVTVDLVLPDADGTEICRRLREFSDASILMLTSHDDQVEPVLDLDGGADDYLVRPFAAREFALRARELMDRRRPADPRTAPGLDPDTVVTVAGGLTFAPMRHVALLEGELVSLTPTEVDLLTVMAREPGRPWSRATLVAAVWGGNFLETDFLIDVHVAGLRKKLRLAGSGREWIRAVEGRAYVLESPGESTVSA
jgi:DNA-binding response OmpR family regulator